MAFEGTADAFVCEVLRGQISAALKLAALHVRVVEETALRERLAQQQFLGELAIAKRIQTALVPTEYGVAGLDIAAGMTAADQVGGDYYDVHVVNDGAFIAMGDVTGHGLLAGLIMVMMQSAVTALVGAGPEVSVKKVVCGCNDVLRHNIRERLGTDEHATFTILRYFTDGRVCYAGAHEDLILLRAGAERCQLIETTGMWLGIVEDIASLTDERELRLEPSDLLVLYTDGLTEARNATEEQFGIERVCRLIERHAAESVARIYEVLLAEVQSWAPVQQDDITLCVLRYNGP